MLFMCMYECGFQIEQILSSCVALAPVAHSNHTENAYYDYYNKYWRSLTRSVRHELWGRGYEDRMQNEAGREVTLELEKAFLKSHEANEEFDDEDKITAFMGHFPHGGVGDNILDHLGQMYRESRF